MKILYPILFTTLLFVTGCSQKETVNWFEGNLDNACIIASDKIIMIDFYTDW